MKRSVLYRVMLAVTALCMVLSLMGCGAALQAVQQLREAPRKPRRGSKPAKPAANRQRRRRPGSLLRRQSPRNQSNPPRRGSAP